MRFYIWGTGAIANEVWNNGVNGEFVGFVETKKGMKYAMDILFIV